MTATLLDSTGSGEPGRGRYGWSLIRDSEGYRDYEIIHRVRTDDVEDGPQTVMDTPGLPIPGFAFWNFGSDMDGWAYCRPDMRVSIHQEKKGDPNKDWQVRQIFSNRPQPRCQDTNIENPLAEPAKVSGGFNVRTEEVSKGYSSLEVAATGGDRDKTLETSSHEPLRGINMPVGYPTIRIELSTWRLGLNTFSQVVNRVNDRELWGLAKRKIRLSNLTWERKLYGVCSYYYTRVFEFEIDYATFDRTYPDYGSLALKGSWNDDCDSPVWTPDGLDPDDFNNFEPFVSCKKARTKTFLNLGEAVFTEEDAGEIDVIYHEEYNFLLLDWRIGSALLVQ